MNIPLAKPEIDDADIVAVRSVLQGDEGCLALGPHLQAFEMKLAGYVGRMHAVAVGDPMPQQLDGLVQAVMRGRDGRPGLEDAEDSAHAFSLW